MRLLDKLLAEITPEHQAEIDKQIEEQIKFNEWLKENKYIYGTPTSHSLILMREHGFNPIGICWYFGEETFIFETDEEAQKGYALLERELCIVDGWWHSKADFEEDIKENENFKPSEIYWL